MSVNTFRVDVSIKKGIEINLPMKPLELDLEELLLMQEEGRHSLKVDMLTLNVNILVYVLNKHFLGSKSGKK